jgi:hypothetical protein
MSNATTIVCKGRGHFFEGDLATGNLPKPGQAVTLTSAGTYELFNGAADGDRSEMLIVREDELLGKLKTAAYADSSRVYLYAPQPGDEIQVLVLSGENIAIGDKLIPDDGTGKFIETTGSPEREPFVALESSGGALGADGHILCRFTGV